MYKMLVLDFDDTLFKDDLTVSEENINAIKKAIEKGVYVLFNSGRSNDSMIKYIDKMDTHDDHEFYASFNGARIDSVGGENIFLKTINQPILNGLTDIGHEFNVDVQYYNEGMIVEKTTELTLKYVESTDIDFRVMSDIKALNQSTKVLFNSPDIDKLKQMKSVIEEKYKNEVNVFFSKPTYLEVLNIEANKGIVVKYLAEKLDIKQKEIIAMGDSYNDLYMIEYAGLGVAVKNGREHIKEKADYITKATNNEDAVKEVIEKFILNV